MNASNLDDQEVSQFKDDQRPKNFMTEVENGENYFKFDSASTQHEASDRIDIKSRSTDKDSIVIVGGAITKYDQKEDKQSKSSPPGNTLHQSNQGQKSISNDRERQSEKLISTNNDNMHSIKEKSPSKNCICGGQPSRQVFANLSSQGSFDIMEDGTQARRTIRAVSKKKDSDQEFF